MTDTFHEVGSIDYPIIDADAHVNEPPNLWQEGVPAKWKERAPKVERTERGDIWLFDGGKERWPVGLTATAGQSPFQIGPMGQTYEKMRPGSFETAARLEDLDADGIWAQVLYPSVTLKGARIYSEERELQLACVRAYNDWLLSFTKPSGGRLIGQAIVPTTGLQDAISELEYAMKSGHKGAVISSFPNGSLFPKTDDEPFWSRAEEAGFPICVHIGSFLRSAPASAPKGDGMLTVDSTGVTYRTKKESIVVPASALRNVRLNESDPKQPWVVVAYEQAGESKSVSFKPSVSRGDASAGQIATAIQAAMLRPNTGK